MPDEDSILKHLKDFEPHLGDPLAYAIAETIGEANLDVVVGSFMPGAERWELSTMIANQIREQFG